MDTNSILFAFGASVMVQLHKLLMAKYGKKASTFAIQGTLFVVAVLWAFFKQVEGIQENVMSILTTVAYAITWYELVLKRLTTKK